MRELVRRAVAGEKIQPMYAEGVADQIAEQSYAEHLEQQQEAAQDEDYDPAESLDDMDFVLDDSDWAGYDDLPDPIKLEVNALLAKAQELGIDSSEITLDAHYETENKSEQAYYELAKAKLEAAIEASNRSSSQDAGTQSDTREQEDLESYSREEVLAEQERIKQSEAEQKKKDAEADKKEKEARIAKEIADRQDASAENFELGQSAEDSLSGQGGLKFKRADQAKDTGQDIPPRYFKNTKVDHEVWIEDENKSDTVEISAKKSLASINEDLDNYKKLLNCMKG